MSIDISKLPPWVKIEVTKEDLMIFSDKLLSLKLEALQAQKQLPEYLFIEEAQKILQCSTSTIHRLVKEGKISVFKINRRNYYQRSQLIGLIEKGRQKPKISEEEKVMNHIRKNQKRK